MRIVTRYLCAFVVIAGSIGLSAVNGRADQIINGPNSAYAAVSNVAFPAGDSLLGVTAHITAGKAGHVLVVTVTLNDPTSVGGVNQTYYYAPVINGGGVMELFPSNGSFDEYFAIAKVYQSAGIAPFATVTSSATWFLDIDAAGLVGQPITIDLEGSTFPFGSPATRSANLSFTAVMQQK
jgi:hypothetical protein